MSKPKTDSIDNSNNPDVEVGGGQAFNIDTHDFDTYPTYLATIKYLKLLRKAKD